MSCLASFLSASAVTGEEFTGGAWKSSEKMSLSNAGAGDGADAVVGVA